MLGPGRPWLVQPPRPPAGIAGEVQGGRANPTQQDHEWALASFHYLIIGMRYLRPVSVLRALVATPRRSP